MSYFLISASSVSVSAWTLVAISCERYYAICHPLRSRRWQTLKHSYKLIALIWCGSLICMSPIAFLSQLIPTSNGKISTHKGMFCKKYALCCTPTHIDFLCTVFTFWLCHSEIKPHTCVPHIRASIVRVVWEYPLCTENICYINTYGV